MNECRGEGFPGRGGRGKNAHKVISCRCSRGAEGDWSDEDVWRVKWAEEDVEQVATGEEND